MARGDARILAAPITPRILRRGERIVLGDDAQRWRHRDSWRGVPVGKAPFDNASRRRTCGAFPSGPLPFSERQR
jgi:hypothetical protein